MKISHQILIILAVIVALYIARDDVKVVYNKAVTSLADKVPVKDNILVKSEKVAVPEKSINTPGALKVSKGLVSSASDVKLSTQAVINATNMNRAMNGSLPPLAENKKLDLSAQMKVDDMFRQQYFEHVSPDHVGVSDLGDRVSYKYIIIGENLALGNFKNADTLLDAWMASPGHRANILNTKYTEIGVAVGHGMYQGQDVWLAVQHFGLPRDACPSIDEVLHSEINLDQSNIKTMEADLNVRKEHIDSGVVYDGKTTNEQISEYNQLIGVYNDLIANVKEKINEYNVSVRAFNACLSASTSK